jgi:hypothetical protein
MADFDLVIRGEPGRGRFLPCAESAMARPRRG